MNPLSERSDRASLEQLTDLAVVTRVLDGDTGLYELILRRYNQRLFRIARSILKNDADAEDAVQDAYVAAYLKLRQYRGPDGLGSWLGRIVTNEALMRRRRRVRLRVVAFDELEKPELQEASMADPSLPGMNPEAAVHENQLQRLLEDAVDELPDAFRAAFVLREIEQLSVAEAAACLGVEPATIKTQVHRARRILQKNLNAELSAALVGTYQFDGARCDRLVTRVFERLNGLAPD
jgi:RNA polymerase sigma-70 factor, ECF subfamily